MQKILKLVEKYCRIFRFGIPHFKWRDLYFICFSLLYLIFCYLVTFNYRFLAGFEILLPHELNELITPIIHRINDTTFFFIFAVFGVLVLIPALGLKSFLKHQTYQKNIDLLGMKSGDGTPPKLVKVLSQNAYKTQLVVKSEGIGLERYQGRRSDLTSAFGKVIEDIKFARNPKYILFSLTSRVLPKIVHYSEFETSFTKDLFFHIGESLSGQKSQSLSTLPHMLIAGTTGGGKSVFFKQTLVGLLKSTENIQLYLIDLKKGVEMRAFEDLPNVRIIQSEEEAAAVLEKLKAEMDLRYELIKKKKVNDISGVKGRFDKIVIGIDEASVLYTKVRSDSSKKAIINQARELTDEIAKLSRAAGIHLILATQKVTKETIDTKVQENIGGRMCFRMNTFQGSNTVLGNKKAYELPDIKGRGIWASGNQFWEVQTPFLSDEELQAELEVIALEYRNKNRKFFGPMIEIDCTANASQRINLKE